MKERINKRVARGMRNNNPLIRLKHSLCQELLGALQVLGGIDANGLCVGETYADAIAIL